MTFSISRAGGALLAAAAGVLLLAGCQDPDPMTITSAVYSHDQAIEGFDTSEATTDDPEQTAQLADLLHEHGLSGDIKLGESCPGGRSTYVDYTTPEGSYHINVGGCDQGEAGEAIEYLIASWRQ